MTLVGSVLVAVMVTVLGVELQEEKSVCDMETMEREGERFAFFGLNCLNLRCF